MCKNYNTTLILSIFPLALFSIKIVSVHKLWNCQRYLPETSDKYKASSDGVKIIRALCILVWKLCSLFISKAVQGNLLNLVQILSMIRKFAENKNHNYN